MRYPAGHPDVEALFRYGDNQLPEPDRALLEQHLRDCKACQLLCEGLARRAKAPGRNVQDPAPPPFSELLSRLPASLQNPDGTGEALKRRVERELAPYVGAAAAYRILQGVSHDGENLLSSIEMVLRLFLGRTAAALLVSRIVDRAIVRP